MANTLAKFKAGRIALHLACAIRKTNWKFHAKGIWRECVGTYADIYADAKDWLKELGKL